MSRNNIKIYRKQRDLTLSEVAKKVGISTGYLCHLEKGTRTNPSKNIMEEIANVLEKTVSEIFFSQE